MKREIKFRALNASGEFIYGLPYTDGVNDTLYFDDYSNRMCWRNENGSHCNQPYKNGTLQQFTGLQDKNGKDIFEGDIVASTCNKMKPKKDETDLFETPEFELKTFHNVIDWFNGVRISGWRIKGKGFQTQLKWSTVGNMNLEVIGNIYDNPELIK